MKPKLKYIYPKNVHTKAKARMKEVITKLNETGAADTVDTGALDLLCCAYSTYYSSYEELMEKGFTKTDRYGNIQAHPLVAINKYAFQQVVELSKEFGLTVKSRGKIKDVQAPEEDDKLKDFLLSKR